MTSSLQAVLLPVLLSTALAASGSEPVQPVKQTTTYFANDPVKWASPEVVLPPTYPQVALANRVQAVVDATLSLTARGRLGSILAINSEPKDASFETAVAAVLKHWQFAQSLDDTCRPIAAESRVKVWFEIKDNQPSISVTHMPPARAPGAAGIKASNRAELVELLKAQTPRDGRMDGLGADVYARLAVDPYTGATRSVDIVTIVGHPRIFEKAAGASLSTNRPPTLAIQYGIAARTALLQARFDAAKAESESAISVCFQIRFTFSDEK